MTPHNPLAKVSFENRTPLGQSDNQIFCFQLLAKYSSQPTPNGSKSQSDEPLNGALNGSVSSMFPLAVFKTGVHLYSLSFQSWNHNRRPNATTVSSAH